jgi:pimeloyl-ACP methyl ester carboxylesterase
MKGRSADLTAMFDKGTGAVVVVIPGMQGRWEWMRPALDALARRCRTISYSLGRAGTLDELVGEVDRVMDGCGVAAAAVCGVSFGGLVALRYAASRPMRTTALVLVSTPSPSWTPSARQAQYLARPWLSTPAFVASSPMRMWPEIVAAIPSAADRARFAIVHAARIAAHPVIPATMAARISLLDGHDFRPDCEGVAAPTLVVTGEDGLDCVVPSSSTREYARLIRDARYEKIDRTGHIGLVTRPDRFADMVADFIHAQRS